MKARVSRSLSSVSETPALAKKLFSISSLSFPVRSNPLFASQPTWLMCIKFVGLLMSALVTLRFLSFPPEALNPKLFDRKFFDAGGAGVSVTELILLLRSFTFSSLSMGDELLPCREGGRAGWTGTLGACCDFCRLRFSKRLRLRVSMVASTMRKNESHSSSETKFRPT